MGGILGINGSRNSLGDHQYLADLGDGQKQGERNANSRNKYFLAERSFITPRLGITIDCSLQSMPGVH